MLLHEVYLQYPIRLVARPGARCTAWIDTRDIQSEFSGNSLEDVRMKAFAFIDRVVALKTQQRVTLVW